jgi:hypothetical protein
MVIFTASCHFATQRRPELGDDFIFRHTPINPFSISCQHLPPIRRDAYRCDPLRQSSPWKEISARHPDLDGRSGLHRLQR